jgi:hypothetical protein
MKKLIFLLLFVPTMLLGQHQELTDIESKIKNFLYEFYSYDYEFFHFMDEPVPEEITHNNKVKIFRELINSRGFIGDMKSDSIRNHEMMSFTLREFNKSQQMLFWDSDTYKVKYFWIGTVGIKHNEEDAWLTNFIIVFMDIDMNVIDISHYIW